MELLAVLPMWHYQLHWHWSCHPQYCKVARSMAPWRGIWQHPLPSWPDERARMGSLWLWVHWLRASSPLVSIRAKGHLRPADGSCVHILLSDSFSHPVSESLSVWSMLLLVATQWHSGYPLLDCVNAENLLFVCYQLPCILLLFLKISQLPFKHEKLSS